VQRDVPIAVWGWGEADEEVTVALGGSTQTTTTQQSGKWSVKLEKLAGSAEPRTVHGGVPAKPIRAINDEDTRVLAKKTKREIPEDLY